MAEIIHPAASSERLAPIGADDVTSEEVTANYKASIMLPPLKQLPHTKTGKSLIHKYSDALETPGERSEGTKVTDQRVHSSRSGNGDGSENRSFLPRID